MSDKPDNSDSVDLDDYAAYGTYDRFIAYRAAVMRAIARAWSDPQYYEKLKKDPKEALKDVNYTFPFDMDLGVDADNALWRPTTVADWYVRQRNTLTMVLPPAPPLEQQPEALANFNSFHLTFLNS